MRILFIGLLLAAGTGYAQSNTIYFDADSKATTPANARYHSVLTRQMNDTSLYLVETFYESGSRMMSGTYRVTGEVPDWHKLYQSDFGGALKEGLHQYFYPAGQLRLEAIYQNGLPEGKIKSYYESGELLSQYYSNQGKGEGEYEEYYENGKLKIKTRLKKGEIDAEVIRYDEDGNIKPNP